MCVCIYIRIAKSALAFFFYYYYTQHIWCHHKQWCPSNSYHITAETQLENKIEKQGKGPGLCFSANLFCFVN